MAVGEREACSFVRGLKRGSKIFQIESYDPSNVGSQSGDKIWGVLWTSTKEFIAHNHAGQSVLMSVGVTAL